MIRVLATLQDEPRGHPCDAVVFGCFGYFGSSLTPCLITLVWNRSFSLLPLANFAE